MFSHIIFENSQAWLILLMLDDLFVEKMTSKPICRKWNVIEAWWPFMTSLSQIQPHLGPHRMREQSPGHGYCLILMFYCTANVIHPQQMAGISFFAIFSNLNYQRWFAYSDIQVQPEGENPFNSYNHELDILYTEQITDNRSNIPPWKESKGSLL